jgi:hypothetical protein
MHSKIIRPGVHGKAAYSNKGSCIAVVTYLGHEARELGSPLTFFNQKEDNIDATTVQARIDGNVKGLRKDEVKFYSLILSPSADELRHINSDPEKLKAFTRQAMENYAGHFNLKDGRKPGPEDVVWFATVHQHRTYKGNEPEVKAGKAKSGAQKESSNAHIHVIVSKRDQEQKVTLNPQGSKDRFCMKDWQRANAQSFDRMFGYVRDVQKAPAKAKKAAASTDKKQERVARKLESINRMLGKGEKLDLSKVVAVGREKGFDRTFFHNLNRLETNLKGGRVVRDPMHLLTHNRDRKPALPSLQSVGKELAGALKTLAGEGKQNGFTEDLSMPTIQGNRRRRMKRSVHTGMNC